MSNMPDKYVLMRENLIRKTDYLYKPDVKTRDVFTKIKAISSDLDRILDEMPGRLEDLMEYNPAIATIGYTRYLEAAGTDLLERKRLTYLPFAMLTELYYIYVQKPPQLESIEHFYTHFYEEIKWHERYQELITVLRSKFDSAVIPMNVPDQLKFMVISTLWTRRQALLPVKITEKERELFTTLHNVNNKETFHDFLVTPARVSKSEIAEYYHTPWQFLLRVLANTMIINNKDVLLLKELFDAQFEKHSKSRKAFDSVVNMIVKKQYSLTTGFTRGRLLL